MTARVNPGTNRFPLYLGAVGASSMAMGLQTVLFPWIVVGVLGEDAHRLGLAQMAVMIPNLLFILVGGALSDSRHLGTHLSRLYLFYALPLGLIITMAFSAQLAYWQLLVYGVVYGMITAFVQPARESLLPQLTQQVLQKAVANRHWCSLAPSRWASAERECWAISTCSCCWACSCCCLW